jgi:tetratricopeptide (TPR) repeat protein
MMLPLLKKRLELLAPWSVDSDDAICMERLNKDQTNAILLMSSVIKNKIAFLFTRRNKFNLAESHCHEALSYARRYDGEEEEKANRLCSAFTAYSILRNKQFDFVDAATFAEEAYNCVAIAYNPVHPKVQEAAGNLIECLIHKGDFYDAERFAQLTLDSLKNPANGVHQDSLEMAKGYYSLGNAILNQNGDLIKAERLGRESYRIYVQLYGNDHICVGLSGNLLAGILRLQGKLGDETKELFERFLAISIRNEGLNGNNTAAGNANLCNLHKDLADGQLIADKRKEHLCLAESYMKEALRISTKVHGAANSRTIDFAAKLLAINRRLLMV